MENICTIKMENRHQPFCKNAGEKCLLASSEGRVRGWREFFNAKANSLLLRHSWMKYFHFLSILIVLAALRKYLKIKNCLHSDEMFLKMFLMNVGGRNKYWTIYSRKMFWLKLFGFYIFREDSWQSLCTEIVSSQWNIESLWQQLPNE